VRLIASVAMKVICGAKFPIRFLLSRLSDKLNGFGKSASQVEEQMREVEGPIGRTAGTKTLS
jgi:hypothetical protein